MPNQSTNQRLVDFAQELAHLEVMLSTAKTKIKTNDDDDMAIGLGVAHASVNTLAVHNYFEDLSNILLEIDPDLIKRYMRVLKDIKDTIVKASNKLKIPTRGLPKQPKLILLWMRTSVAENDRVKREQEDIRTEYQKSLPTGVRPNKLVEKVFNNGPGGQLAASFFSYKRNWRGM